MGRSGSRVRKREGDGATPVGIWPLRGVLYRADRVTRPRTPLPVTPILPNHGWCDDVRDANYNRPVPWPYRASAERLWREDHLYDIVAVLGFNDQPRIQGRGSAIFLHVAAPDFSPTEGCVALALEDLVKLLEAPAPPLAIAVDR